MSLDLTSLDPALKQHYTDQLVEDLCYKDNPLLALMPKYEKFGGRNLPIVLKYKNGGGRSATFSVAQGAAGNAVGLEDFLLTGISDYCVATIDSYTMEISKSDADAFMDAATAAIDGCIATLTLSLARDMYRAGWGALGTISAIASDTITLTNAEDVSYFEVSDVCVFADSESGDTLRNSGAGLTIESIDRSAGTITFTAAVSTETSTAVGDVIFAKGDRQNSATPTRLKVAGLQAWCPSSAPAASESFFGVDRSLDSRLSGLRYAPTAGTAIDEVLTDAASLVARHGGRLTHFFMGFAKYAELCKILGTKVQYVDLKVSAQVGFSGVRIMGTAGAIDVIPDRNCPADRVFGVDMSSWKLYSVGKAIKVIDNDGLMMQRQASADGVEVRYAFRGNVGCSAPIHNVHVTLT